MQKETDRSRGRIPRRHRRTAAALKAHLLASGLGFPEGPVVLADGRLVFCDGNTGELGVYADGQVSSFAKTGGSPWGAALGADGAVYVTQGGPVPGSADTRAVAGIQRVQPDGTVELLASTVAGAALYGPNDLAFGPDGRLWFTDSGSELDERYAASSPGRLFAMGDGRDEQILELPAVYPNGIAFDERGRLYWTESQAHRVCRLENGAATVFCELPGDVLPDGMAFAADGRAFVCTTVSGGVTIVSADGQVQGHIELGEYATNCAFMGSTLYVTATRAVEIDASQRTGSLWAIDTDAAGGLPLRLGALT